MRRHRSTLRVLRRFSLLLPSPVLVGLVVMGVLTGTATADDRTSPGGLPPELRTALAATAAGIAGASGPATGDVVRAATLGTEDRTRLNPAAKAHASIVLLEVGNADLEFMLPICSGTIIGPRVVLTAAICLAPPLQVDSVRVIPGKNGSSEPLGSQLSTRWMIPAEFVEPSSMVEWALFNWALILLPDSSMTDRAGAIPGGLAAVSDATFTDPLLRFAAVGYPYDCTAQACGGDVSDPYHRVAEFSWFAPASFAWPSPDFLYHDADTSPGMWGGPVVRTSDLAVVGITSQLDPILNRSVRITRPVIDRMNDWCRQNGCSINVAPEAEKQSRPHRAFAISVATDSASGKCVAERSLLTEFAKALAEWERAGDQIFGGGDFDLDSPEGRAQFERAFGAFEAATDRLTALNSPDARFAAYLAEIDAAVTAYRSAMRIVKRAIEADTTEELDELEAAIADAQLHFEAARPLYPGLDPGCLAPLGSPFGPPVTEVT